MNMHKYLVVRTPQDEENFSFRLAEVSDEQMDCWRRLFDEADPTYLRQQVARSFSEPISLGEAMNRLPSMNFSVVDLPRN